jgi:hypothetical protein
VIRVCIRVLTSCVCVCLYDFIHVLVFTFAGLCVCVCVCVCNMSRAAADRERLLEAASIMQRNKNAMESANRKLGTPPSDMQEVCMYVYRVSSVIGKKHVYVYILMRTYVHI